MPTRTGGTPGREGEAQKRGRGRPTKLDPKFKEQARKMALLGLTDAEMAGVLGVGLRTFYAWKKADPAFQHAIAQGREVADAEIAASLYERARGYSHPETVITSYQGDITKTRVTRHYPPDTHAASIWLRNRHPTRWRSQPDPVTDDKEAPSPVKVTVQVTDARRRPDPDAEA